MGAAGRWALGADGSVEIDEMDASTLHAESRAAQELKAGDQWVKCKFSTRKRGRPKEKRRAAPKHRRSRGCSTAQLQHAARASAKFPARRWAEKNQLTASFPPRYLISIVCLQSPVSSRAPGLVQPLAGSRVSFQGASCLKIKVSSGAWGAEDHYALHTRAAR